MPTHHQTNCVAYVSSAVALAKMLLTTRLVVTLISSRLDSCNSVFAGLPQSSISSLLRVQNAAARLVFSPRPRNFVTRALIRLHWLPVQFRVRFKLPTVMYRSRTGSCPQYLCDIVHSTAATATRSGLRSGDSSDFCIPRLRTKFGERAFSYCEPRDWNATRDHSSCPHSNIF
jgi:hypothetical protein